MVMLNDKHLCWKFIKMVHCVKKFPKSSLNKPFETTSFKKRKDQLCGHAAPILRCRQQSARWGRQSLGSDTGELRCLLWAAAASPHPSPSSLSFPSNVHNGLPENGDFFLRIDLLVEYPKHGTCESLSLVPVTAQPHRLGSIWIKGIGFFGIICLGSCIMALLASLGGFWSMASPPVHCSEHGQMDISAHFSRASTCIGTALSAFENTSFNEVNLITQFYGQPSCSLIRLDQNFNPYPLVRGMVSKPVLAQEAAFLFPVSKCAPTLDMRNNLQYKAVS